VTPELDRTLAALADPARRRAVDLLQKAPARSSALADALGLSRPAMSRHLRVLRTAGLVTADEGPDGDARQRVYRLRRAPFADLRTWLDEVEGFWTDQLASFKEYVEREDSP
jgi:DNA-binding transcriptional ArsR family regulator